MDWFLYDNGLRHETLKQLFLKITLIHRKKPELKFLFNKGAGLTHNIIKKRLQHRFLPINNANFLKTPILRNICKWLLLIFLWILRNDLQQFFKSIHRWNQWQNFNFRLRSDRFIYIITSLKMLLQIVFAYKLKY